MEAVVRREIENLGYKILKSEDAKITYLADERGLCARIFFLRCADRILVKMGEFEAKTSEDLFQQTRALPWGGMDSPDGKFTVNCTTVKSVLRSEPACQKTVKKAIVEHLGEIYMMDTFPETGAEYTVKVTILRDRATLTIDTSGAGLHKRGYRVQNVAAPIKETLAAAMVQLSFWNADRLLIDPFCGSGTVAIEAAMLLRNIARGWGGSLSPKTGSAYLRKCGKRSGHGLTVLLTTKKKSVFRPRISAERRWPPRGKREEAGVDDCIEFSVRPFERLSVPEEYAVIICNPPYGERIGNKDEMRPLYHHLKSLLRDETLSAYVITADKALEEELKPRAGSPAETV